jgi:hypothetical protein
MPRGRWVAPLRGCPDDQAADDNAGRDLVSDVGFSTSHRLIAAKKLIQLPIWARTIPKRGN